MLEKFIPDGYAESIYQVDLPALKRQGIKGIITDLDNTLVGAGDPHANPRLLQWFEEVRAAGFGLTIVSNNHRVRVSTFADPLALPYIYRARKPFKGPFRKVLKDMKWGAKETAVIGDQLLTDVFGGNRMGLYTILVLPVNLEEESFFTKVNRKIEKWVWARLKKSGRAFPGG